MRVLHVINDLSSGGAEKLIEQSLPLMNDIENVEVDLLLLSDQNNIYIDLLIEKGVKIYYSPYKGLKNPLHIFNIMKFIKRGRYNIVHAHLFPTLYWVSIASKLMLHNNFNYVYTEHSTYNSRRKFSFFRPLEKWIYSSIDKIISISEHTQTNLIKWLNVDHTDSRFTVVYNGINTELFKNANPYLKKELVDEIGERQPLLCMVGRFSRQKDQDTIIKSLVNIKENVHLLLVGEGERFEFCRKISEELGLEERVHFLGFRSDVNRIMKTSDINIISSHWEGFGLAAAEGMAVGNPVVGTNVEGLKSVINDESLLFEVGDYKRLSEIIDNLLGNQNYLQAKAYNLQERSRHFDIEIMVKSLIDEYEKIISE